MPFITSVVIDRLDALADADSEVVDLVAALAVPLPMRVIAHILGVPDADIDAFKRWSYAVVADPNVPIDIRESETSAYMQYFGRVLENRREERTDDLISRLLTAQEAMGSSLPDQEILAMTHTLLVAGNETTTGLIGSMLKLLAEDPDRWAAVRRDAALVDLAVEEACRYHGPVQSDGRRNTRDVELSGSIIPADAQIRVILAAANRDEETFIRGETFSLGRDLHDVRRHLGFGRGMHFCLGASLARTEAAIALRALVDRYSSAELVGPTPISPGSFATRGYASLPVRLRRG